eukprot:1131444-Alexandrium_andersonii.AAC.1
MPDPGAEAIQRKKDADAPGAGFPPLQSGTKVVKNERLANAAKPGKGPATVGDWRLDAQPWGRGQVAQYSDVSAAVAVGRFPTGAVVVCRREEAEELQALCVSH